MLCHVLPAVVRLPNQDPHVCFGKGMLRCPKCVEGDLYSREASWLGPSRLFWEGDVTLSYVCGGRICSIEHYLLHIRSDTYESSNYQGGKMLRMCKISIRGGKVIVNEKIGRCCCGTLPINRSVKGCCGEYTCESSVSVSCDVGVKRWFEDSSNGGQKDRSGLTRYNIPDFSLRAVSER